MQCSVYELFVVDVWQRSSAATAQFDGAVAHCSVAVVFTAFLYLFKKQACDMQLPTQIREWEVIFVCLCHPICGNSMVCVSDRI